MASMFDNISDLLTPAMLTRLAGQTGESESAVVKGLGAVIPTIAACTAARADDRAFTGQLADLATRTAANPDALTSAAGLTSASSAETTAIGNWLSSLFGPNLSGVIDSIARYAGIRGSSATTLLTMGAPLVLTYLGRRMRRDNLSPSDVAAQLRADRPQLEAALPATLQLPSGLRAPFKPVPEAVEATVAPVAAYVVPESERTNWSVPLLLLLGALGIGGLVWWSARQQQEQTRAAVEEGVSKAVGTAGTMSEAVTPGNANLRFPKGSVEDRLSAYLGSASKGSSAFECDRIGFDTGSAAVTPQSNEQLRNVAAILQEYPSANVNVAGHTDSVGNETANMALSRARAESVAKTLTEAGVAPERVHVEGFGSQKPIAENASEAGRSENRRVMVEVVAQ
jgi:outer membrane protein OmpA-like peptidoglycan-associated protein